MEKNAVSRLLFIQYGDFSEAFLRLQAGGAETYRDQKRSVDFVSGLNVESLVVSLSADHEQHRLGPTLSSLGIPAKELSASKISQILNDFQPDGMILRTPHAAALSAASKFGIPILPSFADIFDSGSIRSWIRNFKFRKLLNAKNVSCVANHNLNASLSLHHFVHIAKSKIVPWDWSRLSFAEAAKNKLFNTKKPSAFYAGALSEEKGLPDCLDAIVKLRDKGIELNLSVAGGGDIAFWRDRCRSLNIESNVTWLGLTPNAEVQTAMRRHDMVIIPSRHSYAEGLPNTIYEALASRSPLVISDHPAFEGRIASNAALTFEAGNPVSLAAEIEKLLRNSSLYASLSTGSRGALDRLYLGLDWNELISLWIADPCNRTGWVGRSSIETLGY